jgi:mRNA interferase HigB
MKVLGKKVLFSLSARHADCREWISNWLDDVSASNWRSPQDIKARYATASFLANNVVIFNVRGNRYRLEVQIAYQTGIVVVKWGGTHADYTHRHG